MLSAPRTTAHLQPGKALSPRQYPQAVSAAQSIYLRMLPQFTVQTIMTHIVLGLRGKEQDHWSRGSGHLRRYEHDSTSSGL